MTEPGHSRRIDRILDPAFREGVSDLSLEELRHRRDECLAEREYLSLLRRLVQGRAEILADELSRRRGGEAAEGPLVERLAAILSPEAGTHGTSRGEAIRVGVPEEEMLVARRRVERLVADANLSDPSVLDDEQLSGAVETLVREEHDVSNSRAAVLKVLDEVQEELKRRYKEDVSQVLS